MEKRLLSLPGPILVSFGGPGWEPQEELKSDVSKREAGEQTSTANTKTVAQAWLWPKLKNPMTRPSSCTTASERVYLDIIHQRVLYPRLYRVCSSLSPNLISSVNRRVVLIRSSVRLFIVSVRLQLMRMRFSCRNIRHYGS
jgi:hypothetical protein